MTNLFVSTSNNREWFVVGDSRCQHCNVPILEEGFFICRWVKQRFSDTMFFCRSCVAERHRHDLSGHPSVQTIMNTASFVSSRPKGVRVYVPVPPDFVQGRQGLSVYDADKLFSEKVVDRTRYAVRSDEQLSYQKRDDKLLGDSRGS